MNFPKGSSWRKWDFHVHTPNSYLKQNFGNDWDKYVYELFSKAIEKGVSAIGITDYFCIDGYKKLKTDYLSNDQKLLSIFKTKEIVSQIKSIFVFPNIEFRLKTFVGDNSVNFHVIFSDEVPISDIEDHFLHDLNFTARGGLQGPDTEKRLKKENLEWLGIEIKKVQQEFQNDSDLVAGLKSAVVDDKEVSLILTKDKERFLDKYLIGLPPDEDLSGVDWGSRDGQVRRTLIQKSDFLFASNPNTVEWALGGKGSTPKKFKEEFNSLKPCIWGSDAHDFGKMFEPDSNRYTWIKADLTFEGLRQIKFEPSERVKIGMEKPDQKSDYLKIDKVRFIQGKTQNIFPTEWLELNGNLTTIIGGKSSGKSLLLYYIAKTISPAEAKKLEDTKGNKPYDCEEDPTFDFEVNWSDGQVNRLRENEDKRKRRITFLPQMSINKLVEDQHSSQLQELIQEIFLQNEEYGNYFQAFQNEKDENSKSLETNIVDLFLAMGRINEIQAALKKLGDRSAVQKQIDLSDERILKLTKESALTLEETKKFSEASGKKQIAQSELSLLEELTGASDKFEKYLTDNSGKEFGLLVDRQLSVIRNTLKDSTHFDSYLKQIGEKVKEDVAKLIKDNLTGYFSPMEDVKEKIQKIKLEIDQIEKELDPISARVKNQELLLKEQNLKKEQTKLIAEFDSFEKKEKENRAELETIKEKIWSDRTKFRTIHEGLLGQIQKLGIDQISDIQLIARLDFDRERFSENVLPTINLLNFKKHFPDHYDENSSKLKKSLSLEEVKSLFTFLITDQIKLRAGIQLKDALNKLLQNYIRVNFNLKHKGDEFAKMSPGKRGLVVMKIILHLSNAKEPILIDQPEDNLDNRTIYDELNGFVKERKSKRQLIMVTHNANLVVSTDAEEVIVANQAGQEAGKDNKKYRFEYVSGSLENSFEDSTQTGTLYQKGIKQHVCEILEGGQEAFVNRQNKYSFKGLKS